MRTTHSGPNDEIYLLRLFKGCALDNPAGYLLSYFGRIINIYFLSQWREVSFVYTQLRLPGHVTKVLTNKLSGIFHQLICGLSGNLFDGTSCFSSILYNICCSGILPRYFIIPTPDLLYYIGSFYFLLVFITRQHGFKRGLIARSRQKLKKHWAI